MYLNITPTEVVIQRVKGDVDLTLFNTSNKYMYKDITYTSPIKIVTGPTLYNDSANITSGAPQLVYTSPLLQTTIGLNGTPAFTTPTFIHFDIQ